MGQYNCGGYANAEADKMVMPPTPRPILPSAAILQKVEAMLIDDLPRAAALGRPGVGAKKNVDIKPMVNVMNFPYLR